MKYIYIFILVFITSFRAYSQIYYITDDPKYKKHVEKALDYLKKGQCKLCLENYEKAFEISQKSALSLLRAATCAYDCSDTLKWKSFGKLAIDIDWEATEDIIENLDSQNPEIIKYKSSIFYQYIITQVDVFKKEAGYDEILRKKLKIITRDYEAFAQEFGKKITTFEREQIIQTFTSNNLHKIEEIIAEYGYPGKSSVGYRLAPTAMLVIQMSELSIQEKYLNLIMGAVRNKELEKMFFANFVDRIKALRGEKQLYGSHITYNQTEGVWRIHPIEDEANVDKRRAEMGLEPLKIYAKNFKINYKQKKK